MDGTRPHRRRRDAGKLRASVSGDAALDAAHGVQRGARGSQAAGDADVARLRDGVTREHARYRAGDDRTTTRPPIIQRRTGRTSRLPVRYDLRRRCRQPAVGSSGNGLHASAHRRIERGEPAARARSGRQHETAIRFALGAARRDLLRQHLAEGLMLATMGAAGGLAIGGVGHARSAAASRDTAPKHALPDTGAGWLDVGSSPPPRRSALTPDCFGLVPLGRRADALVTPRERARGTTGDRRTRRVRHVIVTGQIALSVFLLLVPACRSELCAPAESNVWLQPNEPGDGATGAPTRSLCIAGTGRPVPDQLVGGVAALPGVESAAVVNTLPLTGFNAMRPYHAPGRPPEDRFAEFRIVTPDYFRAMEIPLRRGRLFDDRDRTGLGRGRNQRDHGRRLWPDSDPVGQTLMVPDIDACRPR